MLSCSNCEAPLGGAFGTDDDTITVTHRGKVIAALCPKCQETVVVARLTLRRARTCDAFGYEGYVAPERER